MALSPNGDRVYTGGSDGVLHCFDALGGARVWSVPVGVAGGPLTTPAIDSSSLAYVADATGSLWAFDPAGIGVWNVRLETTQWRHSRQATGPRASRQIPPGTRFSSKARRWFRKRAWRSGVRNTRSGPPPAQ
jgi:outer membrane protein assembly factor BamB